MSRYFPGKVKVHFSDLKNARIVNSRFDLHHQIREGKIRPPYKDGATMQSRAWWWAEEVDEDIDRQKKSAAE